MNSLPTFRQVAKTLPSNRFIVPNDSLVTVRKNVSLFKVLACYGQPTKFQQAEKFDFLIDSQTNQRISIHPLKDLINLYIFFRLNR